ncbi:hypothetical protein JW905_10090 [bacterium]|nr:hypothetical protein [candidate division CSSED10-310 bacterium]
MKKVISWGSLLLAVVVLMSTAGAADLEHARLVEIEKAIEASGAQWSAGLNPLTRLSDEEFQRMLGAVLPPVSMERHPGDVIVHDGLANGTNELYLDWRFMGGADWTTPIRDQAQCGSCTAFATVGVLESLMNIHYGNPALDLDLSEEHLFMCSGGTCTTGNTIQSPAMYTVNSGVPDEACFPYTASDQPCSNSCPDWSDRAYKAVSWQQLSGDEGIKTALRVAPVISTFQVYEDFRYYMGGVYEYVWGTLQGGHAIAIIGWNDEENSWIVKNSWGTDWGELGWFRIKRGNCTIGINSIALSMEPGGCAGERVAAGTALETRLDVLRDFRERFLRDRGEGDTWISLYEGLSPEVSLICARHPEVNTAVREALAAAGSVAARALRDGRIHLAGREREIVLSAIKSLQPYASPVLRLTLDSLADIVNSADGRQMSALLN